MTKRDITAFVLTLFLFYPAAFAGDLLPIVFENSEHVLDGKKQKYDLYYIFIGDDGDLRTGKLIQVATVPGNSDKYTLSKAQFAADKEFQEVSVFWPAEKGQKVGNLEKARFLEQNENDVYLYSIFEHSDRSQIGTNEKIRVTDFRRLPQWVRNAVFPHILESLPKEQQVLYHRMQAEQLKATSEIIDLYFKAIP